MDQRDLWDKHLEDSDWIERVEENADCKKLSKLFLEDIKIATADLDEMKRLLCTMPMAPDKIIELREKVMVMEIRKQVAMEMIDFPKREIERLEQIRKERPKLEEEIKQLKEEING